MAWSFNKNAAAAAPAPAAQPAAAGAVPPPAPATTAHAQTLPPLTQPAAPQPAASVATPPKPRGRPRAQAESPQTAAPASTAVSAPVIHDAVVVAPSGGGMLAKMLTPSAPGRLAAAAVTAIAEAGGGELNIFPTLMLAGGTGGGGLKLDKMNEEHSDDDLQEGTKPIHAVLIGYRYLVLCWPQVYKEGGQKMTPKWRAVVGGDSNEDADLLTQAFRAYQFRSRPPKDSKEVDTWDQVGHPAASVELLVFVPSAGLICLKSTWTYDSFTSTSKEIAGAWPDGVVKPIPVLIQPVTEERESKTMRWKEHYLKISHHISPETQFAYTKLVEFNQQAGSDADLNQALTDWASTSLTNEQRDTLSNIASFR